MREIGGEEVGELSTEEIPDKERRYVKDRESYYRPGLSPNLFVKIHLVKTLNVNKNFLKETSDFENFGVLLFFENKVFD